MKRMNYEDRPILYAFGVAAIGLFSVIVLNRLFLIPSTQAEIWSPRGVSVELLVGVIMLVVHLMAHRKCLKGYSVAEHVMAVIISLAFVYFVGLILGSAIISPMFSINISTEPLWSMPGAFLCYWCAIVGYISGYVYRSA